MNQHKLMNFMRFSMMLCLALAANVLSGQTIFTGPPNGDWFTATNWSNGLPAPGNDATISGGASVAINAPLSISFKIDNFGSISNSSTLTLGNTISSGGSITNTGTFTVAAGASLVSSGGFANSGTLNNSGSINSNSAFTNSATGIVNNSASFTQQATFTNDGAFVALAGTFNSPTPFNNNKTVDVRLGATFRIDGGGVFTNATGSNFINAGTVTNGGIFTNNTTVTNGGTFQNNGTQNCTGTFNNVTAGSVTSPGTINVSGAWNNAAGTTTQTGFRFNVLAAGTVTNNGTFTNNDQIEVLLGGIFNNNAGSVITLSFGSKLLNGGTFTGAATSKIAGNGEINNAKTFTNNGIIEANDGSRITNSATFNNAGSIKTANIFSNSGTFTITGTIENTSGGVMTNTSILNVSIGATLTNNFELINKPSASMTNNGSLINSIRLFNEGTITNNGYFACAGDLFNKAASSFTNNEVFEVKEGSIVNNGTFTNNKNLINSQCGVVSNKSTINNAGRFENSGLVFQRGTVSGNGIVALTGFIQTAATSAAPSICRPTIRTGTDIDGEAKVYGQNLVVQTLGIDSCFGFQYFADNQNRRVYTCSQVGTTVTAPFKLITRTGDSLTCTTQVTIFDSVAPQFDNCPKDATVYATADSVQYSWATVTAKDNCTALPTFSTTKVSNSFFKVGTTEVIVSAKDALNNNNDCKFKITVIKVPAGNCPANDVTAPVFSNCPANIVLNSGTGGGVAAWNTPSVKDDCYPITVTSNFVSGSFFSKGVTTVTYTAKDPKNNTSTCTFTVTVNSPDPCATDIIKPIISGCPKNVFTTTNTTLNGGVAIWKAPTASDNCGGATLTSTFNSGASFPVGTTNVVYTATDAKSNVSTCTFTVTVAATDPCAGDVTAPVLTCPANISVNTTTNGATATWTVPAPTDACGGVVLNGSHAPGGNFEVGVTTVTYQASDRKGNTSICTFKVSVVNACFSDTIKPVITNCPANINLSSAGTAVATWTAPSVTDNCSTAVLTSNFNSGASFNQGATNVVYTATDLNGNTSACVFTVTVNAVTNGGGCVGGLKASYFNNKTLTGAPVLERTDATVDYDWGNGSPAPSVNVDNFSARWEGQVEAPVSGVYTFSVLADDGIRLSVNNVLLIDKFIDQAPTLWTATINLVAGQKYPIKIEYYENGGGAVAKLNWSYPGQANQVVPSSRLCASTDFDANKCYKITNKVSGQVLDVEGISLSNFARIFQWTFNGGANQQWNLTKLANGFFEIKNRASGKLLDIVGSGGDCNNGVATEQFPQDNTGSQQWNLVRQADGSFKIFNKTCSTKLLKVEGGVRVNGAKVELSDDNNAEFMKWTITEIPCGSPLTPATCLINGNILVERWDNNTDGRFPIVLPTTPPTVTITQGNTQGPVNIGDNYITRVRGFIRPQATGSYVLNITGDDFAELFVSTDANPANMVRVAFFQNWSLETEYFKYPTQTAAARTLQANQSYYFELRHKEFGGGDSWRISWKTPSNNTFQPIQSQFLARHCNNTFQYLNVNNIFTFDAKAENSNAKLQWLSNGGNRNDYYTVERGTEKGDFKTIEIIDAKNGSTEPSLFNYTDANPMEGENYYRIQTVPLNGTPQYSEVKMLKFGKQDGIKIFPNPANDFLNIDLKVYENKAVNVYFYNAIGKLVKKVEVQNATSAPERVETDDFMPGSYLIRIQTEGKRDVVKQVQILK